MKVLNVQPFHEGISRQSKMLDRLYNEMEGIKAETERFTGMEDALKGQGGAAIRSFYQECHLPFIQFFLTFKNHFNSTLEQMNAALNSLEPNPSGMIRQEFLEGEIEAKLKELRQQVGDLTDEGNAITASVSDIVALPKLNDAHMQQSIQRADQKKDETIEDLMRFDSSQTNSLNAIEEDIAIMEQWLADLEGMVKDGLVNGSFPVDAWKEYTSISPLRTELAKRTGDLSGVPKGKDAENTGDVSGANPAMAAAKQYVGDAKKLNTALTGGISSFRMFMAGKNNGLSITKAWDPKTGKYGYRVHASGEALRKLGVEPNAKGLSELMNRVPKGGKGLKGKHYTNAANNKVTLKYATKKPGQSGWSAMGDDVLSKNPSLAYWNDKATLAEKAKTVGSATVKGAGKSFKDAVDFKGIVSSGPIKGATKALGPISAGLAFYSNHESAKADGLSGKEAAARASVDTGIDLAVSGAVQAGSVALFTALIPIPGVGTAVGIAAGIGFNTLLNRKSKKSGKSIMDNIKGWFH
ncbi:LXG domain-containing protein [Fictibacillus sp. UD]|uniref:ribonuclease YeeF family protein n=1 Tax=Fictibacillus sp. UD TaxID=3038777 RepID=UPI00374658DB